MQSFCLPVIVYSKHLNNFYEHVLLNSKMSQDPFKKEPKFSTSHISSLAQRKRLSKIHDGHLADPQLRGRKITERCEKYLSTSACRNRKDNQ